MADILPADEGAVTPQMGNANLAGVQAAAHSQARRSTYEGMFTSKAKSLVKGVGHVTNSGVPLNDTDHASQILTKSHDAIMTTRAATMDGAWNTDNVVGGVSNDFWSATQHSRQYAGIKSMAVRDSAIRKSFSATNLGLSGVPYGLVPFDLLAPSRLIYPVN